MAKQIFMHIFFIFKEIYVSLIFRVNIMITYNESCKSHDYQVENSTPDMYGVRLEEHGAMHGRAAS